MAGVSATDRVYSQVKEHILTGAIPGGQLLSEGEIAQEMAVSRTPVREAFLRLENEGMLRLYPKRGALVVPVTTAEIRDVMEARALLEPWAFARAAGDPRRAALAGELVAHVEQQAGCLARGDDAGFQDADRAFHEAALVAAGNEILLRFSTSLRDRQVRMGALATRADQGRAAQILVEHRAIAEAVARGDGEAAARLAGEHIAETGAILRQA